jgi:putative ABC transport system substrate-binding protein
MHRLAVLWGGANIPDESRMMGDIRAGAPALGIVVVDAEARAPAEVRDALAAIARQQPDALFVPASTQNVIERQQIVDFALANRLPSIYGDSRFVLAGGLMSYWVNWTELRRQTATYVDKILRGSKPGDLPIEQPTKLELVLNLKTARTLGITIPKSLLLRADQLIH